MQRKNFGKMPCPIARSLERVGEWWSILIIRDALHGFTRFDQFQKSLNIAPNMLTRRLSALVDAGLLQRRRYSERPPRYEYILTGIGAIFPGHRRAVHFFPYFLLNRSMRPAVSGTRCFPVTNGCEADNISSFISG
jgi:DNA-binding HxlR family transcriptional regulator